MEGLFLGRIGCPRAAIRRIVDKFNFLRTNNWNNNRGAPQDYDSPMYLLTYWLTLPLASVSNSERTENSPVNVLSENSWIQT